MTLKPQDVLVVLKLCCLGGKALSFADLRSSLGLSNGEAYNVLKRTAAAKLTYEKDAITKVSVRRFFDYLVHGVAVSFVAERGPVVRGMVTAYSAEPLVGRVQEDDIPIVWPVADGGVRGETLMPLYPTVPAAAVADKALYELLVLVDAIRIGRARDRRVAVEILEKKLLPPETKEIA